MEKSPSIALGAVTYDIPKRGATILLSTPTFLERFIWPATRIILKACAHFTVRGTENLETLPRGVIFAANHSSEADPIVVPAALPFFSKHLGVFYTSREQSFYRRSGWRQKIYGGTLFKLWGAYPVKAGTHDYETSLRNHIELLQKGKSVCIFPEGKKTDTGTIGEAKGGVGYLSLRTGRPVVPVAISGTYGLRLRNFIRGKSHIIVSFGKPLYPKDLFENPDTVTIRHDHDECRAAARKIMSEVALMLKK